MKIGTISCVHAAVMTQIHSKHTLPVVTEDLISVFDLDEYSTASLTSNMVCNSGLHKSTESTLQKL